MSAEANAVLAAMAAEETIVAPMTPAAVSAVALLRLSGPRARAIAAVIAEPDELPARRPVLRWLSAAGERLDRGLVTFFPAPASYTGEDVVEIASHGSPGVVRELLAAAVVAGARPARPGEFTERAVRNGKLDLLQAEAVAALARAQTGRQARAALRELCGETSDRLAVLREALVRLAAELEAGIDFGSEGLEIGREGVDARFTAARAELDALVAGYERARRLHDGIEVAIVGPPNSGKSTLFNVLLAEERALVSPLPGTTRDVISEPVEIAGLAVTLLDTAGLRETGEEIEAAGIALARARAAGADAVIHVIDVSDPASLHGVREAPADGPPALLVRNKLDLLDLLGGASAPPAPAGTIDVSLRTGAGLGELRAALERLVGDLATSAGEEGRGIWRQRHRDAVERAAAALAEAATLWNDGAGEELVLVPVYEGIDALAGLTGRIEREDVLARIFESFCIGK